MFLRFDSVLSACCGFHHPIRHSRTQLKLVCWKNFLTYVRDKKTIGAYVVYPCIMCLLSFSFRRMETLPLDQETNFDYLLLAEGMILVPMLQSLALVNERSEYRTQFAARISRFPISSLRQLVVDILHR